MVLKHQGSIDNILTTSVVKFFIKQCQIETKDIENTIVVKLLTLCYQIDNAWLPLLIAFILISFASLLAVLQIKMVANY